MIPALLLRTFPIRVLFYVALGAFTVGAGTGAWGIYKLWGYADTARELKTLRVQLAAKTAAELVNTNKLREQNDQIEQLKKDVSDARSKIPTTRECFTADDVGWLQHYWNDAGKLRSRSR